MGRRRGGGGGVATADSGATEGLGGSVAGVDGGHKGAGTVVAGGGRCG